MKSVLIALTLAAAVLSAAPLTASAESAKPTIVLVHGAFADASSWNGVVPILQRDGYYVIAPPDPLRGVKSDGAGIRALLAFIKGPVVLVGHSYGGMVISNAAIGAANVKALVYVGAFAPEAGESAAALDVKYPGALLGAALSPVPIPGHVHDLYVVQDKYREAFAPDTTDSAARIAAVTQRPITDAAFGEKATTPAWKTIPSLFIYGDGDTAIPPKVHAFMAARAHPRDTVVVQGASHVVMLTHPDAVAKVIEEAAAAVQ